MTTDDILNEILEREGGFVNNPSDRGKATKFGITMNTLADYRGAPVTVEDVKALTLNEARDILRDRYLMKPGIFHIPNDILRAAVLDYAVHSGPATAIKALQRVLGVPADGVMGGQTLHAATIKTGFYVVLRLHCERLRHVGRIISKDASQAKFAAGWCDRIADQIESIA